MGPYQSSHVRPPFSHGLHKLHTLGESLTLMFPDSQIIRETELQLDCSDNGGTVPQQWI